MRENVRRVSDSSSKILYTSVFFPFYILLYYYSRPQRSCAIQIIYFTRVCESYNIIIMYILYRTRLQKRVWCVFIVYLGELCSVHFRHFHRDNSSREDAYYQYIIIIVIVYATKKNLIRCKFNVQYNNNNDNNTVVVDTGLARSKSLHKPKYTNNPHVDH